MANTSVPLTFIEIVSVAEYCSLLYLPIFQAHLNLLSLSMQLAYLLTGGFVVLSNGLIVLSIGRHQGLRQKKEYIMVGAMAFADFIYGMAYLSAAIQRATLIIRQVRQITIRIVCGGK